ncbi:MAG: hypothetical protein WCF85_18195 [Rhodospirillaceae bacterium]
MTLAAEIARLRTCLAAPGTNRRRVALATGLSWHAVDAVLTGDPRLSTLLKVAAVLPPPVDGPILPPSA